MRPISRDSDLTRATVWLLRCSLSLGKAPAEMGRFKLSGFLARALWSVAHIYFLIGFRNRVAVAHQRRGRATSPEVLLALCLRDGLANVGLQVSARCLV